MAIPCGRYALALDALCDHSQALSLRVHFNNDPLIPMCVQNGTIAVRNARRNGSILNAHRYKKRDILMNVDN